MKDRRASDGLSRDALRRILEITRELARPLDLGTLLYAVVDAAKALLDAEGGTVWQYQPAEHMLEMRVARGLDAIRISADRGIVGDCVRTLASINVPDCYADPRFNRDVDKTTGRRTRCMLSLPLVGDADQVRVIGQQRQREHAARVLAGGQVHVAVEARVGVAVRHVDGGQRAHAFADDAAVGGDADRVQAARHAHLQHVVGRLVLPDRATLGVEQVLGRVDHGVQQRAQVERAGEVAGDVQDAAQRVAAQAVGRARGAHPARPATAARMRAITCA